MGFLLLHPAACSYQNIFRLCCAIPFCIQGIMPIHDFQKQKQKSKDFCLNFLANALVQPTKRQRGHKNNWDAPKLKSVHQANIRKISRLDQCILHKLTFYDGQASKIFLLFISSLCWFILNHMMSEIRKVLWPGPIKWINPSTES